MKFIFSCIAVLFTFTIYAQQGKNFSLWFLNNMQHNPAAVGSIEHDLRLFANFRYQYFTVTEKPFRTFSATVEGKLFQSDRTNNFLGIGASFINDASGDGKYTVNNVSIPISYHIFFDDKNSFSLGISPGLYQRSLSPGNLTWEHQWTGTEFNPGIMPEIVPRTSVGNFDLGAGLYFKHQSSMTNKFYFGFSALHILEPKVGFLVTDDLYRRFVGQFGMSHRFDLSYFGISPQILAMFQGPTHNIIFGTNFDFYLQDPSRRTIFVSPTKFSFGVYHRFREALIVNLQFDYHGFTFAASYDTNINSMLPYSKSVGGFEVAVLWNVLLNKRSKLLY